MITGKDINQEVQDATKAISEATDAVALSKVIGKVVLLILRVVKGMRANQVAIMKKVGVEMRPPRRKEDEEKSK